ncbi:hypothetical protein BGX26_011803, partial [Mortierella sp. AD094]
MFRNPFSSPTNKLPLEDVLELATKQLELARKENDPAKALQLSRNARSLMEDAEKTFASRKVKDPSLEDGIANVYHEHAKLLDELGYHDKAQKSHSKAEKLGYVHARIQHVEPSKPQSDIAQSHRQNYTRDVTLTVIKNDIPTSTKDTTQIPQKIFDQDFTPPVVKYALPEVGERISGTPQLAYCLSLLRPSLVSKEGLTESERDWSQARTNDPDEQNRLQTMATDLIKAFVRDELKKPGVVTEVVSLAAALDQDDFRKLLQIFVDGIDQSVLLRVHLLDGLAQLIRNAAQEYIDADDLVKILELLNKRLKDTHGQSTQNKYRLALTMSHVLDSMVDSQVGGLSREQLHEPLSEYLKQLQESSDSCLVYQAAYANQALQCISDDETLLRTAIRRTGKVIQGISGMVSAVKALDLVGFIDGLQGIQGSLTGAGNSIALAVNTYANVKTLAESGQEFLENLKEGLSFTRKCAWYPALRGLDRFLQEGRFSEFEKLVRGAPCQYDPAFQWGVCQRLGEIAVGTFWDTSIRKRAVSFLGELYKDDATWGQNTSVKLWILRILNQLIDLSKDVIAEETQILLRLLETSGSAEKRQLYQDCKKDHPGPFTRMIVLPPQESLLLDRVQNKPDVETPLLQLRRERLKGQDGDVYISPRAKPSLRATEDFDLTSKVQEFIDSSKKVFLILGDSGAGKSTFNRTLEINLWDKYNTIDGRIPLFIHLPTIDKPEQDLIAKQLRKVDFTENQIRELKLHHREFILICDGYDESQQTQNLYTSNQLNQAGGWRAQMVISCRTEYTGVDYKDCFRPTDRNGGRNGDLFQEAVIEPFNKYQVQDYVDQYLSLKKSPWESKDFLKAFKQIPNLQDLVKNPFLLKLALEVLPELLDANSIFSEARITRVGLYDEFIGQWIDRSKIRLMEIELSIYDKEAFKVLSDSGFKQCGVMYFKELATAIYDNQKGNPVINYTVHRDRRTWKEGLFNNDDGRNLLREAIPLTRNGDQFRFIHKSVLEYGLALAVFDPSEHTEDREPTIATSRRGSASSALSFEDPVSMEKSAPTIEQSLMDSPLGRKIFVSETSILQFLVERARQQPVFKDQLLSVIERSKTDKSARIAAANSITILVRTGFQFNGADLRGIKIPGADLSYGVFDSAQLGDADFRKVNFRNAWLRQANLSGAQMTGAQFGELPFLEESRMIYSGAYSPDGEKYAVGSAYGSISLYETSSWNRVNELKGHSQGVSCIVFSQTSDQIVSGSWDGTVRLWNVETGDCIHTLQGHSGNVRSVMYSPKGGLIVSGSQDNTVRLWDIDTGDCIHNLEGHGHYALAIFSPKGDRIASGSWDTTVRLWDVDTGECVHVLRGHTEQVDAVVYSPKGNQLASGSSDMTVRLWDAETGDCIHTLQGHSKSVTSITYSPKGDQIASGSCDKTVRLWDTETGDCIHTMQGHSKYVKMIVYSPKGDQIASGSEDETVRLWDVDTGDCLQTLQGHTGNIVSVTYSPKGDHIASGSIDKTVRLWDVGAGNCIPSLQAHSAKVKSVVYSPRGCQIASGSWDKTVRLWDVDSGDCIRTLQCHDGQAKNVDTLVYVTCVAYSPKGDRIASKCDDETVRLWDVDTGDCIHTFRGHSDSIWSVVYSPKGVQIASGSWDWSVRLWDTDTGDCVHTLRGHGFNVTSVVYSPKGDRVASGSWDTTIRLWDVDTGDCVHVLRGHTDQVDTVAYSPKGNQIASGSSDMNVRLWDAETGDCVHTLKGHNHGVRIVVFSPKGDQIASGSPDRSVRLWDVDTGACVHILKGHKGYVTSVAYSPKGEQIASGSQDKT